MTTSHISRLLALTVLLILPSAALAQRPCAGAAAPPVSSPAAFRVGEPSAFDLAGDHAIAVAPVTSGGRSIVLYEQVGGAWSEAALFQVDVDFDLALDVTASLSGNLAIVGYSNLFGGSDFGVRYFVLERSAGGWTAPVALEPPPFLDRFDINARAEVSGFNLFIANAGPQSVLVYSRVGGNFQFTDELPYQLSGHSRLDATETRLLLGGATQYEIWTRPSSTSFFAPFAAGTIPLGPSGEAVQSSAIDEDVFVWQTEDEIRIFEYSVDDAELPVEQPSLRSGPLDVGFGTVDFEEVKLARGHIAVRVTEGLGSTFGQIGLASRVDFLDRWLWDGRVDATVQFDRARAIAFDGRAAAVLGTQFNQGRAHFVSVLSPLDDCDANCVPDAAQMATATSAVDRNANGRLDSCESVGAVYCSPAVINSSGASAVLRVIGTARPQSSDLLAVGQRMPSGSVALLIGASLSGFAPGVGGGAGTLCLGGNQLGRYVDDIRPVGADGVATVPIRTDAIPTATGTAALMAGDTWFFQFWFRDVGSSSNLSDAVALTLK